MKKRNLFFRICIFCIFSLFLVTDIYAQIKVEQSGSTIIGPNTDYSIYPLNITGSGTLGAGGTIGFGDNTTITSNVLLGEAGFGTDSDELLLHGKKGIQFSTDNPPSTNMFLNRYGKLGIGIINPISLVELKDQSYLMFNAQDHQAGILFYETGGKFEKSVQYGAFIEYDEDSDYLKIGTNQNSVKNYGIYLFRNHGHVGIGAANNSWTYELKVFDDAHITNNLLIGGDSWVHGSEIVTSDINVKTNIEKLEGKILLDKLSLIEGKSYEYKKKSELETYFQVSNSSSLTSQNPLNDSISNSSETIDLPNFPDGRKFGLIAQEVKEIFPEAVEYDSIQNLFGINYNSFIPILIEAIKEQQEQIESLIRITEELAPESARKSLSVNIVNKPTESARLYQNTPNPFNNSTIINADIPENTSRTLINIYDLNGIQISSHKIEDKGKVSLLVNAGELPPGMYLYALVVDGNEIDVKRMIITD